MNPRNLQKKATSALLFVVALLGLSACTTAPTHSSLVAAQRSGQLTAMLPVRRFVANIDAMGGFVISPDGQKLVWQQTVGTDVGLAVRSTVPGSVVTTYATGNQGRGSGLRTWLADNRHLLYSKDPIGDENIQLFVQDTLVANLSPWAVTPTRGVRSQYMGRSQQGGSAGGARFFFSNNQRDKSTFDLYEGDAQTRSIREIARSDGTVIDWIIGTDRKLAGRVRQLGKADGSDLAFETLQADGTWRSFKTVTGFDSFRVNRLNLQTGKAWVTSNVGRDKTMLVEVDIATGAERVLANNELVDLSFAVMPAGDGGPIGYVVEPGLPQMVYLDAALDKDVQSAVQKALASGLLKAPPVITRPQGFADNNQHVVLRSVGHFDSAELLLDRATGEVSRLNNANADAASLLSQHEPFSFKASDGRTIYGYVNRPRSVTGPVPTIAFIHGGPIARDNWQPAGFNGQQLLVNRGYAVLNINYRGSSGYGRDYIWAGEREYNGRMQKDIAEGVQWAIDQGIADPKRLAVLGASFGGFSVLSQLIHKPHDYQCGVDIVGVANWPRVVESWPSFWRARHYFARLYGDVNKPEDRAQMLANSPISQIDKITAPLLVIHGGNDIRVLKQDSDDVVVALQKLNRPVEYMLFTDEGHSISKWRNRLAMWRKIEDTLASCLGGRSNGFDYYELVPR